MLSFREIGYSTLSLFNSIGIFFTFLGHFFCSVFSLFRRRSKFDWSSLISTLYSSGARLMIPVIIISGILGFSLSQIIFQIFNDIHMGRRALPITQMVVINHLSPLLIGLILSIQSALNLINANVHKLHHTPDEAMSDLIPIMLGIILNGVFLYIYALITLLLSVYSTFQYALRIEIHDNLAHLTNTISLFAVDFSLIKLLIYITFIAWVTGYYYYKIALRKISLRKAVSRIMTRNLLCIIVFSAYFNFFYVSTG